MVLDLGCYLDPLFGSNWCFIFRLQDLIPIIIGIIAIAIYLYFKQGQNNNRSYSGRFR